MPRSPRAGAGRPAGDWDLLERLAAAEPGARARLLQEVVRAQVARVLRIPEAKLDAAATLTSLGMDSLTELDLRNRLEADLGLRLPATLIWQCPTIAALTRFLTKEHLVAAVRSASGLHVPSLPSTDEPGTLEDEEGRL